MNLNEFVKVVGDYAETLASADATTNKDTMAVARVLDEAYEERAWVAEWMEQAPRPKNGGSNRWTADSRNRFAQWTAWQLEQHGRLPLAGRHTYRLLDGVRVLRPVSNLTTGQIRSEYTVRPLKWMLTNRYEDRIPEVWALAVENAGGDAARVTSKHTRDALDTWKRATFGTRKDGAPRKTSTAVNKAAAAAGKANQLRRRILDEVAELYNLTWDERAMDEFRGLLSDLDQFLDEHSDAAP